MRKIFQLAFAFFFFIITSSAFWATDNFPFRDVQKSDEIYSDLYYLYNNNVIKDTYDHMFRPDMLIPRNEFVWIVIWVWCKDCLNPTASEIIKFTISPFLDVSKLDPYYYCISYWKQEWVTQWYLLWSNGTYTCQNNETFSSVPFCPENNTTRIEAAAMLLRTAKIWNDELNANTKRTTVISDVDDKWYWFAKKWIEAWIINIDKNNKIYPNEYINRREFVHMASKIFWINMCELKTNWDTSNKLSSEVLIFDKNNSSSCRWIWETSKFTQKSETVYDFFGLSKDSWNLTYSWEFINQSTWEIKKASWPCLNDFDLVSSWTWNIKLTIKNIDTQEISVSYAEINVQKKIEEPKISSKISIYDKTNSESCDWNWVESEMKDKTVLIYDFYARTTASWNLSYEWLFKNEITWETIKKTWKCLNDFKFIWAWTWKVKLIIKDDKWNSSLATSEVQIYWECWINCQCPKWTTCSNKDANSCSVTWYCKPDDSKSGISVNILWNPLEWEWPLKIQLNSIIWWDAKISSYEWIFCDWTKSSSANSYPTISKIWICTIVLNVKDSDWNTWTASINVNITDKTNKWISVQISWNPIIWEAELKTIFTSRVSQASWNVTYDWSFWDWVSSNQTNPTHIFKTEWNYTVILRVTDEAWNVWVSQLTVKVVKNLDTDKDWLKDSDDKCSLVAWPISNSWCPIVDEYKEKQTYTNTISSSILIFDKENPWSCSKLGKTTTFPDTTETTYDFVWTTWDSWDFEYVWHFTNISNWESVDANWPCLNNFNLWASWKWIVTLVVIDKSTWKTSTSSASVFVSWICWNDCQCPKWTTCSNKDQNSCSRIWRCVPEDWTKWIWVSIKAVPLSWYEPLDVAFSSIVNTSLNLDYLWEFCDWTTSTEKNPSHTFTNVWACPVKLTVKDVVWNTAKSNAIINVTWKNWDDDDWDWIVNEKDYCQNEAWPARNNWCPDSKVISTEIWNKCLEQSVKTIWAIEWLTMCNSCPCSYSFDFKASLRKCDIVFPAITNTTWDKLYSRWKIYQIK